MPRLNLKTARTLHVMRLAGERSATERRLVPGWSIQRKQPMAALHWRLTVEIRRAEGGGDTAADGARHAGPDSRYCPLSTAFQLRRLQFP
jgi:hypothetical protein